MLRPYCLGAITGEAERPHKMASAFSGEYNAQQSPLLGVCAF
jgi:hypothetical protein